MSKALNVRLEDGLAESLRARAERDGKPVSWVVSQALMLYLAVKPAAAESLPPRAKPSAPRVPTITPPATAPSDGRRCRDCGHLERQHTNAAMTSGTGCGYGVCSCRRFVAGEA